MLGETVRQTESFWRIRGNLTKQIRKFLVSYQADKAAVGGENLTKQIRKFLEEVKETDDQTRKFLSGDLSSR